MFPTGEKSANNQQHQATSTSDKLDTTKKTTNEIKTVSKAIEPSPKVLNEKQVLQQQQSTPNNEEKHTVKQFIGQVIKIYETTPSKTMKYVALGSAIILFLGVLSLVLAQKDEAVPNKYGMAFPLDDAASSKAEHRVQFPGVPGEGTVPTPASDESITTTETVTEVPTTMKPDGDGGFNGGDASNNNQDFAGFGDNGNNQAGAILIAGDEDEKPEDNDQRIVFIERLMGLHLTAPGQNNQQDGDMSDEITQDPKNKVNAKWASRTRKFSIPIPTDAQPNQAIPSNEQQPHPMLRYAAAAMMSRLIAAAARAQMEAQAREALMPRGAGKDKDDDMEDESVPVLLATVRDEQAIQRARQSPPMYGRPMPRPMMRPQPPSIQARQQMVAASMAQRLFANQAAQQQSQQQARPAEHPMLETIQRIQALQAIQQLQQLRQRSVQAGAGVEAQQQGSARREPGTQQALAMVVIPIQSQESRQVAAQLSPYASAGASSPYAGASPYGASPYAAGPSPYAAASAGAYARPAYYPSPYASPYYGHHYQHAMSHPAAASYAVPVHAPPPMSHYPYGYRPSYGHYPVHRPMHPAYSHMRQVIEVPVEVPVPVHVPVPVAVRDHRESSGPVRADHDASPSDQDHIVLLYDAEVSDQDENEDLQHSASEAHEKMASFGPKGHHFLNQQLSANPSLAKLKLWREMVGAKHAAQPGVRYMPVAFATAEDSQPQQQQQQAPQQMSQQMHQMTGHHGQQQPQHQHQPQQPFAHQAPRQVQVQMSPSASQLDQSQQQPAFIMVAGEQPDEQQ